MRHKLFVAAVCAAAMFASTLIAQQRGQQPAGLTEKQFKDSREAQEHVTKAMSIAKPDLLDEFASLCSARGPQRPAVLRQEAGLPPVPRQTLEPTKIFDNLYFLGFNDVGAWAITTSQGIIVIDTLYTPEDAEKVLVPGMQKAGLDPKQIKYVIVGHGHFDHFGGSSYLQKTYNAHVLMSAQDWDFIKTQPPRPNTPLPTRDIVVTDGQKLTLGDTTIMMRVTPGHTPGSLAILIPVKDKGKPYMAFMPSGGFAPDGRSFAAIDQAISAAKEAKAVALLSGHPGIYGDTLLMLETRRKNPSGPNPFFYTPDRFARYLDIADECSKARTIATEQNK
jgi:metallo-beta-lactamase class B